MVAANAVGTVELTDGRVAEIERAAAGAARAIARLYEGANAVDVLGPLREAYRAAGVERMRAALAVAEWVVSRSDPRACLAVAARLDGR